MRLHIEYYSSLDPVHWQREHDAGNVPDRLPYGLDRLEAHDVETVVRGQPGPKALDRLVAAPVRRATGFDFAHALRGPERRSCDAAFCWDERTGVPAALRSVLPGEPPVATGVIWLTDAGNTLPAFVRSAVMRGLQRAQAVWALSEPQLDVLAQSWKVPRARLHFIPFGIDADFWHNEGLEPEPGLVVSAGNDRHRDHELLIDAMRMLDEKRAGIRLELVTPYSIDVPDNIGVRRERLPAREIRSLYGRASVVAVSTRPNLHGSGMTVLLEAMACGRPVVVTNTPGISEYVRHEVNGLLVPVGDPVALANAIGDLLAEPEKARSLGEAGRASIEERFSTHHQADRLSRLLHSVVLTA